MQLRRHRSDILFFGALALVIVLCWWVTANMANTFYRDLANGQVDQRMATSLIPLFVMWSIMMLAMMLPTAYPAIVLFTRLCRQRFSKRAGTLPLLFTLGYVACWLFFSLLAAALQQQLALLGAINTEMLLAEAKWQAVVLIGAGVYQLTAFKLSCLQKCRHPVFFILLNWRRGWAGAWQMGLQHGMYCLGCCWFIMCLLFVGGVMHLGWVTGLMFYALLEKTQILPAKLLARSTGIMLVTWGMVLLF